MKKKTHLDINPKTKIGELLETYPELEAVLIELAPTFKKLKNPLLRKTIGKVASLQQAASIGEIPVGELIRVLRSETGQSDSAIISGDGDVVMVEPDWFNEDKVFDIFDASPLIDSGGHPMPEILSRLDKTGEQDIFKLITPFIPAPIIDLIAKKGYFHYCRKINENEYHTFLKRDLID